MTRSRLLPGLVLASLLIVAPTASAARSAVYGGHIPRGEPIVVTADAKFQKLRTIVVASELTCPNGDWMPFSMELSATKRLRGFGPAPGTLDMITNANGTFAGRFVATTMSPTYSYGVIVDLNGKLKRASASGSFDITEIVIENATGNEVATCSSGKTKFSAPRSAGRVFGGMTRQQEPVVALVDIKRHKIKDIYFSWVADCGDAGYFHNELVHWQNVAMSQIGSFRISETDPFHGDDGSTTTTSYSVRGKVGKASASGSVSVHVDVTDASGGQALDCQSGQLKWSAITG